MSGFNNLDLEFRRIVEDTGWWIVLRSFNITKHSKYWREASQEAIGGPAWEYNDIIIKGRRVEAIAQNSEQYYTRQQLTDVYRVVFYMVSKVRPKKEDCIFEIPIDMRTLDTAPKLVSAYEIFDIEHAEYKIDKHLIFTKCYCSKVTPINDVTLKGPIPVRYVPVL